MEKKQKRIEITLDEDHPIFSLPRGTRTAAAKEWLMLGMKLKSIENEIRNIKIMLENLNLSSANYAEKEQKKENGFDPSIFADKISEFFG